MSVVTQACTHRRMYPCMHACVCTHLHKLSGGPLPGALLNGLRCPLLRLVARLKVLHVRLLFGVPLRPAPLLAAAARWSSPSPAVAACAAVAAPAGRPGGSAIDVLGREAVQQRAGQPWPALRIQSRAAAAAIAAIPAAAAAPAAPAGTTAVAVSATIAAAAAAAAHGCCQADVAASSPRGGRALTAALMCRQASRSRERFHKGAGAGAMYVGRSTSVGGAITEPGGMACMAQKALLFSHTDGSLRESVAFGSCLARATASSFRLPQSPTTCTKLLLRHVAMPQPARDFKQARTLPQPDPTFPCESKGVAMPAVRAQGSLLLAQPRAALVQSSQVTNQSDSIIQQSSCESVLVHDLDNSCGYAFGLP
eukprot:359258-Chlamydomonas_euryale.AAC.3